ncbi:MAG: DEAD/DEAH box helicase, partial [Planctomycetota bacterium]
MNEPPKPAVEEPENPLPEVALGQLPQPLRDAAGRAGWTELMPVQARGIPYLLEGRDMMIQARTGSGKTGAFLLPMLANL